jgi:hypothetical protein
MADEPAKIAGRHYRAIGAQNAANLPLITGARSGTSSRIFSMNF